MHRWLIVLAIVALPHGYTLAQSRAVTLEIVVGANDEIGIEQKILEKLESIGADNLKISRGNTSTAVGIEELQGTGVISVKVTGVYQNRNLILPGGKFALADASGISAHLQKIRDDGAQTALADKLAFGMTSEQLVALNETLSVPLTNSTSEWSVANLIAVAEKKTSNRFLISKDVAAIVEQAGVISDELKGVSTGTALAITLRPHGLVLMPRRLQGQAIEIQIVKAADAKEFWPIGWPNEGLLKEVAPSLLERLDVEIRDFKLGDTLKALQMRVNIPIYVDRNSLAEKEIELNEVLVTYVKKRAEYLAIFKKIVSQSRPALMIELRVDEAGKPFLWLF